MALGKNEIPAELDILSSADRVNEYLMTSLRTSSGCDLNFLKTALDYDLIKNAKPIIDQWISSGFCFIEKEKLVLTQKGRLLADKLASDLFVID
jgi:oxygen-independent coproporphyrinogen-3 oxidase